jgi:hypothetical protein
MILQGKNYIWKNREGFKMIFAIIAYIALGTILFLIPMWGSIDYYADGEELHKAKRRRARLTFAFPIWPLVIIIFISIKAIDGIIYLWRMAEFRKEK